MQWVYNASGTTTQFPSNHHCHYSGLIIAQTKDIDEHPFRYLIAIGSSDRQFRRR